MTGTQAYGGRTSARAAIASFHPQVLPDGSFRRLVAQWFYATLQCRYELGLSESKSDQLRGHMLSLMSFGEWAQREAVEKRIDLSPIGITVEDLQAENRIFRDTFRSAFDNCLSESEAETMLKEVFG